MRTSLDCAAMTRPQTRFRAVRDALDSDRSFANGRLDWLERGEVTRAGSRRRP